MLDIVYISVIILKFIIFNTSYAKKKNLLNVCCWDLFSIQFEI